VPLCLTGCAIPWRAAREELAGKQAIYGLCSRPVPAPMVRRPPFLGPTALAGPPAGGTPWELWGKLSAEGQV